MNYGSYNEYSKSQFHRFKRNPLPPKTENGEYMTYDQYAYERDKLLKEYYTDFWTDGTLYADWSQFFYSIFGFTISPQIWQALGYIAVGIGFTASGVFSYPQIFLECFLNSLSQIFVGTYFRIFDNIPNFVWMVLNCFYESSKVVFFTLINCREIYFSTIRILENICSMILMIFNILLSIIIKVYITISKLLLFGKENMACYKKELKHEIKSLEKVKVQKSIRKRFDNIHKKFDAFINKKIRKQLNLNSFQEKAYFDEITRRMLDELGLKTSYYPTTKDKLELASQTGHSYKQINRWYQNARWIKKKKEHVEQLTIADQQHL